MDEQEFAPRIDMRGFAADMATMRAELSRGLGDAAELGARTVEGALLRAVRTGKFGFEELKATALSVLDQIARLALRQGVGTVGDGGLLGLLGGLASGLPGRATGGPVSPDRPYLVGERGPEVFRPHGAGTVEPLGVGGGMTVNVMVQGGGADSLVRSEAQIAQALARAVSLGARRA